MIIFRFLIFALSTLLLFTVGCDSRKTHSKKTNTNISRLQLWMSSNGKLKVLCTTAMIAELVQELDKEHIDCLTLIQGESDPHSYQLVKGDDEKLSRADLIFYNGLGLEHGPSLAGRLKDNPKAFSIGEYLSEKYPEDIILYNGILDPHIWMDVSLWKSAVPFISETLGAYLPKQRVSIQQHADILMDSLQKVHNEILATFMVLPSAKRYLVSAHEAFNYFVRAYLATNQERLNGSWIERSMAPEGLAPDSQLSTADIQRMVDHIVKFNVSTLFAESNVSRDSLKKLTDACLRMGHVVSISKEPLYVDAMGPASSKAGTYVGMMTYDSLVIAKGLS